MIREVVKATGDIITVAGNGNAGYNGDNGPATAAELNGPDCVAVDSAGDLFIGDGTTTRSARWSRRPATSSPSPATVKGVLAGDGGPATAAELYIAALAPSTPSADLFIADPGQRGPRGRRRDRTT